MIQHEEVDGEVQVTGVLRLNFEDEVVVDGKWHAKLLLSLVSFGIVAARVNERQLPNASSSNSLHSIHQSVTAIIPLWMVVVMSTDLLGRSKRRVFDRPKRPLVLFVEQRVILQGIVDVKVRVQRRFHRPLRKKKMK